MSFAKQIAAVPIDRSRKRWIDEYEPDVQRDIAEVREWFQAGKFGGKNMREVYDILVELLEERGLKLSINHSSFARYLKDKPHGQKEKAVSESRPRRNQRTTASGR